MWIEENRGKLRMYERYTDGEGQTHKMSVPLSKDAPKERKAAYALLMEKIANIDNDIEMIRFSALVDKFISRPEIKESTRKSYSYTLPKITQVLHDPYVNKINSAFVKRALSDAKLNATNYNRYLLLIKMLIKYAKEYGYTDQDIVVSSMRDKSKVDPESKYLTGDELKSVLDQLEGSSTFYLIKFLALTGCRIGEALALTTSDYDGKYIYISKTMVYGRIQTAKTVSSKRDIYVQKELRELMAEYLTYRNLELLSKGFRTDLLFFNSCGEVKNVSAVYAALQRVKCDKHLHPHIFRHTHVSLLAESGYGLDAISRRLGHSDSDITKEIYFHVTEKMKEREERQLEKITLLS